MTMKIGPNARVVLDYELKDDEGEVLDASDGDGGEPIVYVHGYGMLVPGLEAALAGLEAGASKEIVVTPEDGYYWDTKHGNVVAGVKMMIGALVGKTMDDSIEGKLKP